MLKVYMKIFILIILGFYSGCSSKDSSVVVPSNETKIESLETGVIVGSLLGHVTGTSVVAGTIMGGMVGFSGGKALEQMQLGYLDKENILFDKILKSVDNQKELSAQIHTLREKITQLDQNIDELKETEKPLLLENKHEVTTQIKLKKDALLEFKKLNDSAIDDVLAYNNLVSYTKYPQEKKKKIENTLDNLLSNLFNLRQSCENSLEELNKLEEMM